MLANYQGTSKRGNGLLPKRRVLRAGFALLTGLLGFSAWESYRTQGAEARESLEIYQRQVEQDALHYRLRRTLWLASIHARDFLLNPASGREQTYATQLRELQEASVHLLDDFDRLTAHGESSHGFRRHLDGFWLALERLPHISSDMNALDRYEFVQSEIVPRRNAVGDALREFSAIKQQALRSNLAAFEANQREAAWRLSIMLGVGVILGVIVAWTSLSHNEKLEQTAENHLSAVERAREELQMLAGRLISVQEDERTRLSRELHDEIGQALATIRLEVVRARSACGQGLPEIQERLLRVRELAERSVNVVRNLSSALRPSVLDDLGLGPALGSLADEFTRRTGIPCRVSIPAGLAPVSESVATCVYRVVQESLHNCEKHANASVVSVTATSTEGTLAVSVADDGAGFEIRPGRRAEMHLGLLGMTERAIAAGGQFRVESAPGRGTVLTLELPMDPGSSSEEDRQAAFRSPA